MDLPEKLGDYELLEEVGRGRTCRVYRARQYPLQRDVALKVLKEDLSQDQDFVRRFHSQAVIASSLNHPNVCRVFDIDEDAGRHFVVLEYLDGLTLASLLGHTGALHPSYASQIIQAVARGLAHAHERGVFHGGVRAEDVVVVTDTGRVVLTDFGIAGLLDPARADGRPSGDVRSDLRDLGCLFYLSIAGEPMEEGSSRCRLTQRVPEAPGWIERIIDRCLTGDPRKAYEGAADLARDIDLGLSGRGDEVVGVESRAAATYLAQAPAEESVAGEDRRAQPSPEEAVKAEAVPREAVVPEEELATVDRLLVESGVLQPPQEPPPPAVEEPPPPAAEEAPPPTAEEAPPPAAEEEGPAAPVGEPEEAAVGSPPPPPERRTLFSRTASPVSRPSEPRVGGVGPRPSPAPPRPIAAPGPRVERPAAPTRPGRPPSPEGTVRVAVEEKSHRAAAPRQPHLVVALAFLLLAFCSILFFVLRPPEKGADSEPLVALESPQAESGEEPVAPRGRGRPAVAALVRAVAVYGVKPGRARAPKASAAEKADADVPKAERTPTPPPVAEDTPAPPAAPTSPVVEPGRGRAAAAFAARATGPRGVGLLEVAVTGPRLEEAHVKVKVLEGSRNLGITPIRRGKAVLAVPRNRKLTVRIYSELHSTVERTVELGAREARHPLALELTLAPELTVTSKPPGVTVLLGDREVGTTGREGKLVLTSEHLKVGEKYVLRAVKAGYREKQETFTAKPGPRTLALSLEPLASPPPSYRMRPSTYRPTARRPPPPPPARPAPPPPPPPQPPSGGWGEEPPPQVNP